MALLRDDAVGDGERDRKKNHHGLRVEGTCGQVAVLLGDGGWARLSGVAGAVCWRMVNWAVTKVDERSKGVKKRRKLKLWAK